MRDASLRWGLKLGAAAAAIGIVLRLIGVVMAPIPAYTTAETVVVSLAVQGFLVLGSIGVALGLANYAGQRVERERQSLALAPQDTPTEGPEARDERMGAVLAGLYVMLCFWFVTALYAAVAPPVQEGASRQAPNVTWLLITGVLYALLGAGCGGLGGRTVVARRLVRGVVKPAGTAGAATPFTKVTPPTEVAPSQQPASLASHAEPAPPPSRQAPLEPESEAESAPETTPPTVE